MARLILFHGFHCINTQPRLATLYPSLLKLNQRLTPPVPQNELTLFLVEEINKSRKVFPADTESGWCKLS